MTANGNNKKIDTAPIHLWNYLKHFLFLAPLNPPDLFKSPKIKCTEPPMETAPQGNRCNIFFHTGVACQNPFEDMVTSRQWASYRKSSHTRRFRGEIKRPSGPVGESCLGSPSISSMATKGDHQAALSSLREGADNGKPRLWAMTCDV